MLSSCTEILTKDALSFRQKTDSVDSDFSEIMKRNVKTHDDMSNIMKEVKETLISQCEETFDQMHSQLKSRDEQIGILHSLLSKATQDLSIMKTENSELDKRLNLRKALIVESGDKIEEFIIDSLNKQKLEELYVTRDKIKESKDLQTKFVSSISDEHAKICSAIEKKNQVKVLDRLDCTKEENSKKCEQLTTSQSIVKGAIDNLRNVTDKELIKVASDAAIGYHEANMEYLDRSDKRLREFISKNKHINTKVDGEAKSLQMVLYENCKNFTKEKLPNTKPESINIITLSPVKDNEKIIENHECEKNEEPKSKRIKRIS